MQIESLSRLLPRDSHPWAFCMAPFLALALCLGQDSLPSGPPVGAPLRDFKIQTPAGKVLQFAKEMNDRPTLLVFVHRLTRPGLKMLRPIDEAAATHDKLFAQVVFLSDDAEEMIAFLTRAEKSLNLQVPASVCLDGKKAGPETYGLNDQIAITILLANKGKVVANFAFVDPNDTDSPNVLKALEKLVK